MNRPPKMDKEMLNSVSPNKKGKNIFARILSFVKDLFIVAVQWLTLLVIVVGTVLLFYYLVTQQTDELFSTALSVFLALQVNKGVS